MVDVEALIEQLRATGGDTAAIEVKSGEGGFPQSVLASLSALANLPGGGMLIIGLDETTGFRPVRLPDPQVCMQTLGNKARALQPPAQLDIDLVTVNGLPVVVAEVHECDLAAKPCRIASSGRAYVRSHDGDFMASPQEEQGFLRLRSAPMADHAAVADTGVEDLDRDLVERWRATVRARDEDGLGRFDDGEMLIRAGAVTRDGVLTKAGLLGLGSYPQQHFPRFAVHVADMRASSETERARNIRTFTGPIPIMLAETLSWLAKNLDTRVFQAADGSLRDEPEYPLAALRELVANALVHRDLDSWSEGRAVELRLRPNRLELINPGGLYGVTADRLGAVEVTSARNRWLLTLCENVTDRNSARVVEALASGLTKVTSELRAAGLPPARFFDTGIMFTVALTGHASPTVTVPTTSGPSRRLPEPGTNLRRVLDAVVSNPHRSTDELAHATGLTVSAVRTALVTLRAPTWNLVRAAGGRGRRTTYAPISTQSDSVIFRAAT